MPENRQSDRRSGTVLETGGAGDGPAEFNRTSDKPAELFVKLLPLLLWMLFLALHPKKEPQIAKESNSLLFPHHFCNLVKPGLSRRAPCRKDAGTQTQTWPVGVFVLSNETRKWKPKTCHTGRSNCRPKAGI